MKGRRKMTRVVPPRVPSIVVEERSREERWCAAGQALHDAGHPDAMERFDKVLALAEGYASPFTDPTEDDDLFAARLALVGERWTFGIKWRTS